MINACFSSFPELNKMDKKKGRKKSGIFKEFAHKVIMFHSTVVVIFCP